MPGITAAGSTKETRRRRDEIMREAQQYSDRLLEDAHAKAREAAVSALNLAAAPQSDEQQRAAQAELAYLRTYGDVYRAHLRAYTEGILRGIEEWERKETASLKEAAQSVPSPVPPPVPSASPRAINGDAPQRR